MLSSVSVYHPSSLVLVGPSGSFRLAVSHFVDDLGPTSCRLETQAHRTLRFIAGSQPTNPGAQPRIRN